jgi:hypothetical protein
MVAVCSKSALSDSCLSSNVRYIMAEQATLDEIIMLTAMYKKQHA